MPSLTILKVKDLFSTLRLDQIEVLSKQAVMGTRCAPWLISSDRQSGYPEVTYSFRIGVASMPVAVLLP